MVPRSEQNPQVPRQRRSLSPRTTTTSAPTTTTGNNNGGGGFEFIVGTSIAELKSKKQMTKVRKQAMRAYLETNEKGSKRTKNANERPRLTSEDSTGSGNKDAASTTIDELMDLGNSESGYQGKQSSATGSFISYHNPHASSPEHRASTARRPPEHVLEAALIVRPSRTSVKLPYDVKDTPLFVSFGEGVDPFGTMFQSRYKLVSVERMKFLCARFFGTYAMGQHWIPTVLSSPHTFLSTLCVASTHLDAIQERPTESIETLSLRQEIMHLIDHNLVHPNKQVDDLNITALVQLIASEVIGRQEGALDFHAKGIAAMIEQRGGLNKLGVNGYLASTISWIQLESAILREERGTEMYAEYCAAHATRHPAYLPTATIPESPIYRPRRQFETLKRSVCCKKESLDILNDMYAMLELFLSPSRSIRRDSKTLLGLYNDIVKYQPLSKMRPRRKDRTADDFRYEAIRITAIVQATAIVERLPLSEALPQAAAVVSMQLSSLYAFPPASRSSDVLASPLSPMSMNARHDSMVSFSETPSYAQSLVKTPPPNSHFDDSQSSFSSGTIYHPSVSSSTSHPSLSSIGTSYSSVSSVGPSHSSVSSTSGGQPSVYPVSSHHPRSVSSSPFEFNPFAQYMGASLQTTSHTLLKDLKAVLEASNLSECWKDMAGVLLWIALTFGAASHRNGDKVLEKWYSALAMRVSILLCFEHPEAIHSTTLRMSQIVEGLSAKDASDAGALVRTNDEALGKRRRMAN